VSGKYQMRCISR